MAATEQKSPQRTLTRQSLQTMAQTLARLSATRAGVTFSGERDLYETLGYKRILAYEDYKERYERGGIASRIIDAFPDATWRAFPTVRDRGKADEETLSPFEMAWQALVERLNLHAVLMRADRLASLGHYAVVVLGLRGQTDWQTEAQSVRSPDDLVYLNVYSEEHAQIQTLASEERSPLFGQPASYLIDFSRRAERTTFLEGWQRPALGGRYGAPIPVHASRVLHVSERGLEDDLLGTPRLQAVWNYLDDLEKVVGGTAEMTWQDAKRRLVLSLAADAQLDAADEAALTAEVEEFVHSLRNFLRVQGAEVTQLAGSVPNPTGVVTGLLDLIAGTVRIPKRLLVGSERGELASVQDDQNWAATILERQRLHAEPRLVRPLIARCQALRLLPPLPAGVAVEWAPLVVPTESQRAQSALQWSQAIATYAGSQGSPQDILPLEIFLEDILEWPKDQVQRILQLLGNAMAADSTVL